MRNEQSLQGSQAISHHLKVVLVANGCKFAVAGQLLTGAHAAKNVARLVQLHLQERVTAVLCLNLPRTLFGGKCLHAADSVAEDNSAEHRVASYRTTQLQRLDNLVLKEHGMLEGR